MKVNQHQTILYSGQKVIGTKAVKYRVAYHIVTAVVMCDILLFLAACSQLLWSNR